MSTQKPDGILIYGELTSENKLRPAVKQLLTKARSLQLKLGGEPVRVCVICGEINCSGIISEAGSYGADEVIIISLAGLEQYDRNYYPEIFYQTALKYFPRIILTGADIQSKEISAYAAARLNTGLTADCTNLDIGENNLLLSTRPAFGGQLTADILCRTFPQMASVQENVFKEEKIEHSAQAKFEIFDLNKFEKRIEIISTESKTPQNKDITKADIVIAGGLGACRDNGFELINKLAEKLCRAAAGGSREAYERGYITKSQQIGQTGKTIAPKLYIAAGISGALQHLAAIKNAKIIIAVNTNPYAPIFKYADYGITEDLFKVLPELINNCGIQNKEKK